MIEATQRKSIVVLSGGTSCEREVSLQSGVAVSQALRHRGHLVSEVDPAITPLESLRWSDIRLAFLALHGAGGEDGVPQTFLESRGIPYTGSGPRESQLAFSKTATKQVLVQAGIPTPPWQVIDHSQTAQKLHELAGRLGFPLMVKPDQQGSSLGVSLVSSPESLISACELAFSLGPLALLEQAIVGDEWTVGLLNDHPLPPIRIQGFGQVFDFYAKYHSEHISYLFDSDQGGMSDRVSGVARAACLAVGTRGVARVDLMVDSFGRPFVLEINTIPGFTDHSLVPKAAAHVGLTFDALCDWCVEAALCHFEQRRAA
ncbi:MAG: D-alanine--D-alanine ligase [Planctomycetaceae bacterium]|jgi:D-alanine-D-alanine ligase